MKNHISAQFDTISVEKKVYDQWLKAGAFDCKDPKEKNPFTIIMPPANVTGRLHLGHALTFTLQDIIIRFERMRGKNVLWQPGTDHAGIATQMVVERSLEAEGLSRSQLGKAAFLEKVWEWKATSGGAIIQQLKSLGASADWSRERFTMDAHASRCVANAFISLYKQGLIYKDYRLVNWDTHYQTAVSDLEVISKEQKGTLYYIRYPFKCHPGFLTIATTRPETCFADTALAVHPEDPRYKDLIGKTVVVPCVNRPIKIVGDFHSDPEKGTGVVKITPAHDFNDFEVGKRHDLEFISVINETGHLNQNVPESFQNLTCLQAREKFIAWLKENELLEKEETIQHAVPLGDRSGTVIEPRLTEQWYVDAKILAVKAKEVVEKEEITFFPTSWKKDYLRWLEEIQPWCISRQIWWGHPIPAWYGPDKKIFVAETKDLAEKEAQAYYGKSLELVQDSDVLDTWFSSALWPFVTLGWPEQDAFFKAHYPTDVLVTGFDILFFWVARMVMMGIHFTGKIPFRSVLIHALVRDAQGQKMSKSKGNVIDPMYLIETYGADALRFALSWGSTPGKDIRMSEEKVGTCRNFSTKIWNAVRYAQMNGCAFVSTYNPEGCNDLINQWIVHKMGGVTEKVHDLFEKHLFHEAAQVLYHFFWGSVCDWYIEFSKPIFNGENSCLKTETQNTLGWVLATFCRILHPIMPFITEEVFASLGGAELLILSKWPVFKDLRFTQAEQKLDFLIAFITTLRSMRADLGMLPSQRLMVYWGDGPSDLKEVLIGHEEILKRVGRLKEIKFVPISSSEKKIQFFLEGVVFDLVVDDEIDLEKEIVRLENDLQKNLKERKSLMQRLSNSEMRKKAPESVLKELEARLKDLETVSEKTQQSLVKIKALCN